MIVEVAGQWLGLLAWGAHTLLPWQLATAPARRRLWRAGAAPCLLVGALALLSRLRARPDAALAAGLAPGPELAGPALLALVALAALAAVDALLLAVGERIPPAGWRLAGAVGGLSLAALALVEEGLRAGMAPGAAPLAGLAVRALLALAVAESLTGPRRLAPLAGAALPLYLLALSPGARAALAAGTGLATPAAASLLLLLSAVVPRSLRRPAALAGSLLAALFLAVAGMVGDLAPLATGPGGSLPPP